MAIVRVSSRRQEGNISHETQEAEIRAYAREQGLNITQVIRLVESAKDSDLRLKFSAAMARALAEELGHVLFYMFDRETRNLTDTERSEKLIKSGVICIHYVRDNKVLHQGSPDSEFMMRDVSAAINKQYSRALATRVNGAMRQKAESGWYPSNSPPLGYAVIRAKDSEGRELKRGGIIGPHPDTKKVKQVLREFELRARSFSYEQIRQTIVDEGFIKPKAISRYRKCVIEKRINNIFYEGRFYWQGVEYAGKHERIIPQRLIEQARAVRRATHTIRSKSGQEFGHLTGWIHCKSCGCLITYDPKTKKYRTLGTQKTFHYYRCSNGRKAHESLAGLNVPESALWAQFENAVAAIHVPASLAKDLAYALNSGRRAAQIQSAKAIAKMKSDLLALDEREDRAYGHLDATAIDPEIFRRQMNRLRQERVALQTQIEEAKHALQGGNQENAHSIIELCKNAKSLYKDRNAQERRSFLEKILSNPILDGVTIEYDWKTPFSALAKINAGEEWRTQIDDFRTGCASISLFFGGGSDDE